MSAFKRYIAGGIVRAEYGFYDEDGLFCGGATSLANGEDSGMARWLGMKSIDATFPEVERVTQTGDDQRQGTLTFQPTDPATLGIQMGVASMDDEAAVGNVNVYDDGQFEMVQVDPYLEDLPVAALMVHSTAKKRVVGERPTKGFEVHVFNSGEINTQGFDGITERELRNYDFFMALDQVFTWPWGAAMSKANEGSIASSAGKFTTADYVTLHAIREDASEMVVNLDYVPVGAESVSGVVKVWRVAAADGAVTSLTNTTDFTLTTGGVFTLTTAGVGAAGDHLVVRYKHTGALTS